MLAPRSSAAMMRMSQPFCSLVSHHLDHATFPAPATSNAACGFPRTALSCLFRLKAYGPILQERLSTAVVDPIASRKP
jgi:hypothetical protein